MGHPDDDGGTTRGPGAGAPHLDEGTVHAWLDGQLSDEESARVESHIACCAECAAVVAHARGLVAASSRILAALDGVPRVARPGQRRRVRVWPVRAAAATVVLAIGTTLVLRDGSKPAAAPAPALIAKSAPASPPPASAPAPPDEQKKGASRAAAVATDEARGLQKVDHLAGPRAGASALNSALTTRAKGAPPSAADLAVTESAARQQAAPAAVGGLAGGVRAAPPAACVGRVIRISTAPAGTESVSVRFDSAPSRDPRYPGFALRAAKEAGPSPGGAWIPLGTDSALVSLPAAAAVGQGEAPSLKDSAAVRATTGSNSPVVVTRQSCRG